MQLSGASRRRPLESQLFFEIRQVIFELFLLLIVLFLNHLFQSFLPVLPDLVFFFAPLFLVFLTNEATSGVLKALSGTVIQESR